MWNRPIIINQNNCFLCKYMFKSNWLLWSKLNFQHHYSSLQCHMIFRNHSNMLICCSRNISDYYQFWKQLCCPIFMWKPWYNLFFTIHRWIESSKEQHLFEIEIFCNIINAVFPTRWFICGGPPQYPHRPPQIPTAPCHQLPRLTHTNATSALYLATFRPF